MFKMMFSGANGSISNNLAAEYIITHIVRDIADYIRKDNNVKVKIFAFIVNINCSVTSSIDSYQ